MQNVIIVSKCSRVTKISNREAWYEFQFKGVCAGEVLRKLILRGSYDFLIKKDQEYLLYVQMINYEAGVYRGLILKAKNLEQCWDRS